LKPPIARNAAVWQKRNDPAAQRMIRLSAFHEPTHARIQSGTPGSVTVQPPATAVPLSITWRTSSNKGGVGEESASTKRSQSPDAAAAPALRAREIWLSGSNTTCAPAARATSAVRSVELLSQTMSSVDQ